MDIKYDKLWSKILQIALSFEWDLSEGVGETPPSDEVKIPLKDMSKFDYNKSLRQFFIS